MRTRTIPDPVGAPKIISSIPFGWSFFLPHVPHPSSVKIQENSYVLWFAENTGCAPRLNISLPLPGSAVLKEMSCPTTDVNTPEITGAIHHSTALVPGVETVSRDPRKNFLLSTWRPFELGSCFEVFNVPFPPSSI